MTVLVSSLTGCATMQSTSGSSLYNPAQRVFLVRHAERFNDSRDDPPLTAEGKGRAKALADTPRDARVSAIITSQWMRAKDTAQHLSGAAENCSRGNPYRRSTSGVFPGDGERVRRLGTDTVLVVGHIRIPNIIAELGDPQLSTTCESVFFDLFLLVPALGWDGLTRLRYGSREEISPRSRKFR